jgi:hypothetical protein
MDGGSARDVAAEEAGRRRPVWLGVEHHHDGIAVLREMRHGVAVL